MNKATDKQEIIIEDKEKSVVLDGAVGGEMKYVDPRSIMSDEKKPWELWIEAHTPYRVGWWKSTFREPFMLRLKVFRVFMIMLSIPTSLFVGIEWWYSDAADVLKDAQKGSS